MSLINSTEEIINLTIRGRFKDALGLFKVTPKSEELAFVIGKQALICSHHNLLDLCLEYLPEGNGLVIDAGVMKRAHRLQEMGEESKETLTLDYSKEIKALNEAFSKAVDETWEQLENEAKAKNASEDK